MSKVFTTNLQPSKKIVLLALADFANDDGKNIFPAVSTIANKSSLSHRSVQTIIGDFLGTGILRITKNPKGGAPGSTRHLIIDLAALDNLVKLSRDEESASVQQRGAKKCSEGVQSNEKTSATTAPKPSVNLHENTTDKNSDSGSGGELEEFEWPLQLDLDERQAIQTVLTGISKSYQEKQFSLDELRAALVTREIPRKAAWVRTVLVRGIERTPAGKAYERARKDRSERKESPSHKHSEPITEIDKNAGRERLRKMREALKK